MSKETEMLQTFLIEYKDELNRKIDTVKSGLEVQIEKFYVDAHGMMEGFRVEFRGSMKDITDSIKEIVDKLKCHDNDITDLKNRIYKIEAQKTIISEKREQVKKTMKETIFYIIDKLAAPVLVSLLIAVFTVIVMSSIEKKHSNIPKEEPIMEMNLYDN